MRKGFTLLELIVVIVILGIMATLAATQYTKMVEKSRGAEARTILGTIRTNQAAITQQTGSCSSANSEVGIGVNADFPSACTTTHYFSYSMGGVSANSFTATATRCTSTSKNPAAASAGTISLVTNFDNGMDSWTLAAPY